MAWLVGGVEGGGGHLVPYMEARRASSPSRPGDGTGGGMCGFSSNGWPRGDLTRGYIKPSIACGGCGVEGRLSVLFGLEMGE